MTLHIFFFFSSRRRHTRLQGDWSSDVCSSDLTLFDIDLDATLDRWIYIGDSTNDQLMFEHMPHSVGVANIARFVPQLKHLPRHVTRAERGDGFAEMAQYLLTQRP